MSGKARRARWLPAALVAVCVLSGVAVRAEEANEEAAEKADVWSDKAELSLVATDGNSSSMTLGLKNTLLGVWGPSSYKLEVGAIRAETTTTTRIAVGPDPGDFQVIEDDDSAVTAEFYYVDNAYARKITDRSYWGAGARWERNRPSGIDNRTMLGGLYGNIWLAREDVGFKTEYGLTATWEDAAVEDPRMSDPFLGARVGMWYWNRWGAHTIYRNELVLDEDLNETSDFRADWLNSVEVAMSEKLALKVGLRFLYDNMPALQELPLEFPAGTPTGDLVTTGLDDLDTIFTASLVVNF